MIKFILVQMCLLCGATAMDTGLIQSKRDSSTTAITAADRLWRKHTAFGPLQPDNPQPLHLSPSTRTSDTARTARPPWCTPPLRRTPPYPPRRPSTYSSPLRLLAPLPAITHVRAAVAV
ncbi:hypothetical protein CVT25_013598 [Psilocybe cyanescens]|uniref:Secreted protein n=1 Tax=Psilocybe cyanescens TaxID=93625 RepID=A0A409WSX1_PSICY|nr:hypothetical protein CVT25_013598 [Psilocybe cyanescens]